MAGQKIAEYYDVHGRVPSQWEMYDLKHDPRERHNLAYKHHHRTSAQEKQYRRLRQKLARVSTQRLQPLPDTPQPQTDGRPNFPAPHTAMD